MHNAPPALDPEAEQIAKALLAQTGRALLARDPEPFLAAFDVPHRISTFDKTVVVEDRAELTQTFLQVCAEFTKLGVTDITRECIAAQFRDPDTIAQTYISHLIAGQRRVKDPYPCFSILTRRDGVWRVSSSDYAIAGETSHARALTALDPDFQAHQAGHTNAQSPPQSEHGR